MDKRYQVFVSSTYADLREERRAVIETLMKVDCIPAGMELFPASDEEQFSFIKRVIDDCDYYLLIIGGRYGSVDEAGVSYTEKEYEYAQQRGLKVIAILHGAPEEIPAKHSEKSPDGQRRLAEFRDRVSKGRLVDFWTTPNELQSKVALAMLNATRIFPAIGWVRANRSASEDVLSEINELRKEKERLQTELVASTAGRQMIPDLADLNEKYTIFGSVNLGGSRTARYIEESWARIFGWVAPHILAPTSRGTARRLIANRAFSIGADPLIKDDSFETIEAQLEALGFISIELFGTEVNWILTPVGRQQSIEVRVVRTRK